jgi:hypothetical protein
MREMLWVPPHGSARLRLKMMGAFLASAGGLIGAAMAFAYVAESSL